MAANDTLGKKLAEPKGKPTTIRKLLADIVTQNWREVENQGDHSTQIF